MTRMGFVIELKSEKVETYKKLHVEVWPSVLKVITCCNIRNYTIFLREPENLLFAYYEYHGTDYEADMKIMKEDKNTQKWWELTSPCQRPLNSAYESENWATMEEVFHHP